MLVSADQTGHHDSIRTADFAIGGVLATQLSRCADGDDSILFDDDPTVADLGLIEFAGQ
jgi:hypothetical protein